MVSGADLKRKEYGYLFVDSKHNRDSLNASLEAIVQQDLVLI
jgi:hypothetical protein